MIRVRVFSERGVPFTDPIHVPKPTGFENIPCLQFISRGRLGRRCIAFGKNYRR